MDRTPHAATREELAALLRWYVDMGVDMAVDETPHDRFAESLAEPGSPATPAPAELRGQGNSNLKEPRPRLRPDPTPRPPEPTPAAVEGSPRDMANAARTLEELRAALEAFEGCGLKRTATRLVFADGEPTAPLMLIGEAPGADEDRLGRPFVGKAGQLLDRMLAAIGLDRTSVYIANIVPWRPPGNRAPTPQETALCLPFILRQIALANPRLIVCLGNSSAQALLGYKEGITRARGRWVDFAVEGGGPEGLRVPAMGTLHPAYLLRRPVDKRLAWRDWRAVRRRLDG